MCCAGEEFNLKEDLAWTFFHFSKFQRQFYLSAQYYANEQLFLFYVMVIGGQEVAEDYSASISISNDDQSVTSSFRGPVLAVDRYVGGYTAHSSLIGSQALKSIVSTL